MKVIGHHWFLVGFLLFFPLVIIYGYVDHVRESELNARLGWYFMLAGAAYIARGAITKTLFVSLLVVVVISGLFDILYATVFGGIFTSATFDAFKNTDTAESIEFLISYFSLDALLFAVFYTVVFVVGVKRMSVCAPETKLQKFSIFLALLMFVVAVQQVVKWNRTYDTVPGFSGVAIDYQVNSKSFEASLKERKDFYQSLVLSASKDEAVAQTYVVVIGESLSRNHMSLYGYPRKTTPFLDDLGQELIRFEDVVAPYAQTKPSLSVSLTEATLDNPKTFETSVSLVDIAKKAGFKVWWISNQQPRRLPATHLSRVADKADFISHQFRGVMSERYDEFILPSYQEALQDQATHKLIIVHLMGSHLEYKSRYPQDKAYFKDRANIKAYKNTEELTEHQIHYINAYDDSVLYTDWLLMKMIKELKQQPHPASLTFFSDHGEEVYDSIDFKGHRPNSVTRNMIEIPFLVWNSDAFKAAFSQKVTSIEDKVNVPFLLDRFYNYSLCWMGLTTDINPEPSAICGENSFVTPQRIIYNRQYPEEY